jgi:hypothetical protein
MDDIKKAVFPKEMNNSRFLDRENQQGSNVHHRDL